MTGEAITRKARAQGGHVEAEVRRAHGLYDRDVRFLDGQLERLFTRLRADSGAIETHLVVVADHGECFGEGGTIGHGRRLADETLRVPLFIVSPKMPRGLRHDTAGSVDLAPTILSLAGVPRGIAGARDLTRPPNGPAHAFGMRRTWAAAAEDVRLDDGSVSRITGHQFYAVSDDGPLHIGDASKVEMADGTQIDPTLSARLAQLFRSFENRLRAPGEPTIDPEIEQGLRALGYVN